MNSFQNPIQMSSDLTFDSCQSKFQSKTVYLDVSGKMHSLYRTLLSNPPTGYHFVTTASNWDNVSNIASSFDALYAFQLNILAPIFPPNLIKAYLERLKKTPIKTALTYSVGHLVFRREPWVVDLEFVTQLTGYKYHHFKRFRGLIENAFSSEYCKKIICWTEAGKKTIMLNMNCKNFEDKIELVPLAVSKKNFVKKYNNKKIKLLFVGSANIPGEFEYKGGKEILEAFSILKEKYENLELVIRSDIPEELKIKYHEQLQKAKVIEGIVPWSQLEHEFKTADIFLFPSHSTPGLAILDAMSYELPVVTTNLWANTEMVENGKTGVVINKSANIQYYVGNLIPNWSHYPTSEFMRKIKGMTDLSVVKQLAEAVSVLIENEGLRRSMGKAGRRKVEDGEFSIKKRNEKLRRILDEAIQ